MGNSTRTEVMSFYGSVAPEWDAFMSRPIIGQIRDAEARRILFALSKLKTGSQVLNVGIGTAEHEQRLERLSVELLGRKFDYSYLGIDILSSMLRQAQAKYPLNGFLLADTAISLPIGSNWVDGCIAEHVFSLIPDEELPTAIDEIVRILKPDGVFTGSVFIPSNPLANADFHRNYPGYKEPDLRKKAMYLNLIRPVSHYQELLSQASLQVFDTHYLTWDAVQISARKITL